MSFVCVCHICLSYELGSWITSLSPIGRGFMPGFVNYKKMCTRLATASDTVYQLLAHGRWLSLGTPASSTIKTCRHKILPTVALKIKIKSITYVLNHTQIILIIVYKFSMWLFCCKGATDWQIKHLLLL